MATVVSVQMFSLQISSPSSGTLPSTPRIREKSGQSWRCGRKENALSWGENSGPRESHFRTPGAGIFVVLKRGLMNRSSWIWELVLSPCSLTAVGGSEWSQAVPSATCPARPGAPGPLTLCRGGSILPNCRWGAGGTRGCLRLVSAWAICNGVE